MQLQEVKVARVKKKMSEEEGEKNGNEKSPHYRDIPPTMSRENVKKDKFVKYGCEGVKLTVMVGGSDDCSTYEGSVRKKNPLSTNAREVNSENTPRKRAKNFQQEHEVNLKSSTGKDESNEEDHCDEYDIYGRLVRGSNDIPCVPSANEMEENCTEVICAMACVLHQLSCRNQVRQTKNRDARLITRIFNQHPCLTNTLVMVRR